MEEFKCVFHSTLVTNQFGCENSLPVTRRGGPDIACQSDDAHRRCEALFGQMRSAALPAFGVEDDPLSMPHSVQVKIQFGGLLGLQRLVGDGAAVSNIHALIGRAVSNYSTLESIPCVNLVQDMISYKLKRRG